MIDSNLKFNCHINNIRKTRQRASLILRCFICRDADLLCRTFVIYVRPLLEYSSQVWSPCYLTEIKKIESVQRRFTKRLKELCELSYNERLIKLGIESLELRRLKLDLCFVYKLFYGLIAVEYSELFDINDGHYDLRGHSKK